MPPVLQYENVSKEYRGSWRGKRIRALDDFSLEVEQGEIFGFLGPNGAGKTTAIHLAVGFMHATSGTGTMLGAPFGHASTRKKIGFLPENVALYHRNARDLLRFYGTLNRMRDPELAQRTHEVLATVAIDAGSDRNVGKFSRGMLQRVGIAQALVNDPELLILDEPTSALDPIGRAEVRELLLMLKRAGKTVFLSSHLLSEVEAVCDRVGIVNHGRLLRIGTQAELLVAQDKQQITARGIDSSLIPGAIAQNGTVTFVVPRAEQRAAIELVWTAGGEVVSVAPMRRTLEELFLELTNGASKPKPQEVH